MRNHCSRALPDITSGPEVRQIFKIRTVQTQDVFLPGRQTFFSIFFSKIFFSVYLFGLGTFDTKFVSRVPILWELITCTLVGKMFKNISPDSVQSGRTCPANLGVRPCPVRKLICPVRSSPTLFLNFSTISTFQPKVKSWWGTMIMIVWGNHRLIINLNFRVSFISKSQLKKLHKNHKSHKVGWNPQLKHNQCHKNGAKLLKS